ncbi:unnamed protein product, partial [Didymodactylos carnosus]
MFDPGGQLQRFGQKI